jgi:hypothetical protein
MDRHDILQVTMAVTVVGLDKAGVAPGAPSTRPEKKFLCRKRVQKTTKRGRGNKVFIKITASRSFYIVCLLSCAFDRLLQLY